jgi:hypothetical protein
LYATSDGTLIAHFTQGTTSTDQKSTVRLKPAGSDWLPPVMWDSAAIASFSVDSQANAIIAYTRFDSDFLRNMLQVAHYSSASNLITSVETIDSNRFYPYSGIQGVLHDSGSIQIAWIDSSSGSKSTYGKSFSSGAGWTGTVKLDSPSASGDAYEITLRKDGRGNAWFVSRQGVLGTSVRPYIGRFNASSQNWENLFQAADSIPGDVSSSYLNVSSSGEVGLMYVIGSGGTYNLYGRFLR